jgi:hypothetical protein
MEQYYAAGPADETTRQTRINYARRFDIDTMARTFADIYKRIGRDQ